MKYLKMLGLAAVAAMSCMALFASSASATTLEVDGDTVTEPLTITASLEKETTVTLARTDGSFANTCTGSHAHGTANTIIDVIEGKEVWTVTGPFTGHGDGRPPENGLSFSGCTRPVTVHEPGTLEVVHIPNTTDGIVYSKKARVTSGSPFGTLNCETGVTTKIGILTGTDGSPATKATLDVDAVLNCGFLVPSATWKGSYEVTDPHLLGVEN